LSFFILRDTKNLKRKKEKKKEEKKKRKKEKKKEGKEIICRKHGFPFVLFTAFLIVFFFLAMTHKKL
jgi:L-lactate permease